MARKGNNKGQAPGEGATALETVSAVEPTGANSGPVLPQSRGNGNGHDDAETDRAGAGNALFSSDEIAERAYQIFEREGRMDGRDMEHWLQAEGELRAERENRTAKALRPDEAPRSARQHLRS